MDRAWVTPQSHIDAEQLPQRRERRMYPLSSCCCAVRCRFLPCSLSWSADAHSRTWLLAWARTDTTAWRAGRAATGARAVRAARAGMMVMCGGLLTLQSKVRDPLYGVMYGCAAYM
jgi:hypothetical protein